MQLSDFSNLFQNHETSTKTIYTTFSVFLHCKWQNLAYSDSIFCSCNLSDYESFNKHIRIQNFSVQKSLSLDKAIIYWYLPEEADAHFINLVDIIIKLVKCCRKGVHTNVQRIRYKPKWGLNLGPCNWKAHILRTVPPTIAIQ